MCFKQNSKTNDPSSLKLAIETFYKDLSKLIQASFKLFRTFSIIKMLWVKAGMRIAYASSSTLALRINAIKKCLLK